MKLSSPTCKNLALLAFSALLFVGCSDEDKTDKKTTSKVTGSWAIDALVTQKDLSESKLNNLDYPVIKIDSDKKVQLEQINENEKLDIQNMGNLNNTSTTSSSINLSSSYLENLKYGENEYSDKDIEKIKSTTQLSFADPNKVILSYETSTQTIKYRLKKLSDGEANNIHQKRKKLMNNKNTKSQVLVHILSNKKVELISRTDIEYDNNNNATKHEVLADAIPDKEDIEWKGRKITRINPKVMEFSSTQLVFVNNAIEGIYAFSIDSKSSDKLVFKIFQQLDPLTAENDSSKSSISDLPKKRKLNMAILKGSIETDSKYLAVTNENPDSKKANLVSIYKYQFTK